MHQPPTGSFLEWRRWGWEKPDAVGLHVLALQSTQAGNGQTQPPETNSTPSKLVSLWFPFRDGFIFFQKLCGGSGLLLTFRLNNIFPFPLFCETSSGQRHARSPAPRGVRVLQLGLQISMGTVPAQSHSLTVLDPFWDNSRYCPLSLCTVYIFILF